MLSNDGKEVMVSSFSSCKIMGEMQNCMVKREREREEFNFELMNLEKPVFCA